MAITLADAFGTVVVTQAQAASMFSKFAEMVHDSDPELSDQFNKAIEAVLDYPDATKASTSKSNG